MWKDIIGYEGLYQVNNVWLVKSISDRFWKERILKPLNTRGYNRVCLYKHWKQNPYSIHRLVAQAFITNPENKPQVNHKNGIKNDNNLENLEWVTASENMQHAFDTWLKEITENHNFIKNNPRLWKFWKDNYTSIKINQYTKFWEFLKTWDSIMDVQRQLWIWNQNISACCSWKRKTAWWFIWKFK